jgi:hypothetical protein
MTITLVVLATFILYRVSDGRLAGNILSAIAIAGLYALLDPSLRNLPIMAYVTAGLTLWAGLQVLFPAIESPIVFRRHRNVPVLQIGRFAVAMVPAGV